MKETINHLERELLNFELAKAKLAKLLLQSIDSTIAHLLLVDARVDEGAANYIFRAVHGAGTTPPIHVLLDRLGIAIEDPLVDPSPPTTEETC